MAWIHPSLEQYDLSYRIPRDEESRSLVVEVLPQDLPDYENTWSKSLSHGSVRVIRLKYKLDSMQPGIPTWFIARCHRFTTYTHWRNGVVFADTPDVRNAALIEADPASAEIDFTARGPAPWQLFAVVRDGLEDTLKRYSGLKIERFIPCPGHAGEACRYLFNHDTLLRRLKAGIVTAECQQSFAQIPITELLFGIGSPEGNDAVLNRIDELENTVIDEAEKNREELRELRSLALDNHIVAALGVQYLRQGARRRGRSDAGELP